jgi:hypothetical protein
MLPRKFCIFSGLWRFGILKLLPEIFADESYFVLIVEKLDVLVFRDLRKKKWLFSYDFNLPVL